MVTEEKKHKKSSARKKGGRVGEPKCPTQVSAAWRCTLLCKKSFSLKLYFCPDRSSSPWFSQLVLELTASFQLSSLPNVQPAAQSTHVRRTYAETREEMTDKKSQQVVCSQH